jgi:hypothetical protein
MIIMLSILGPVRLSLLSECCHALASIISGKGRMENAALVLQAILETSFKGLVYNLFSHNSDGL